MAQTHEFIDFGDNVKDVFDVCMIHATIDAIDPEANSGSGAADITIENVGQVENVPIFYHCQEKTDTIGGGYAFHEDDEVLVLAYKYRDDMEADNYEIVGFSDGLKTCETTFVLFVISENETGSDTDLCIAWDIENQCEGKLLNNSGELVAGPVALNEISDFLEICEEKTAAPVFAQDNRPGYGFTDLYHDVDENESLFFTIPTEETTETVTTSVWGWGSFTSSHTAYKIYTDYGSTDDWDYIKSEKKDYPYQPIAYPLQIYRVDRTYYPTRPHTFRRHNAPGIGGYFVLQLDFDLDFYAEKRSRDGYFEGTQIRDETHDYTMTTPLGDYTFRLIDIDHTVEADGTEESTAGASASPNNPKVFFAGGQVEVEGVHTEEYIVIWTRYTQFADDNDIVSSTVMLPFESCQVGVAECIDGDPPNSQNVPASSSAQQTLEKLLQEFKSQRSSTAEKNLFGILYPKTTIYRGPLEKI